MKQPCEILKCEHLRMEDDYYPTTVEKVFWCNLSQLRVKAEDFPKSEIGSPWYRCFEKNCVHFDKFKTLVDLVNL